MTELRQNAVVEDTDFRTPRGLDRALFHKLAACDWVRHSQRLVISGPTGVGKSWLAQRSTSFNLASSLGINRCRIEVPRFRVRRIAVDHHCH